MSNVGYVGPLPETDKSAPPQSLPTATQNVAPPVHGHGQPASGYGVAPPTYGEATGSMPPPDPGAPLPYDRRVVTTTTTSQVPVQAQQHPYTESEDLRFHQEYLRSIPGIFQIVECSLSLIVFICASVHGWGGGQGWVRFVSMSAFLSTLIYLILNLVGFYTRISHFRPIRFIYYCVFSVLFWIAFIVAAAYAPSYASIAAASFFAFCASVVYSVDTFLQWREWRTHREETSGNSAYMTSQTVYTTTTTTTGPDPGQGQGGVGLQPPPTQY